MITPDAEAQLRALVVNWRERADRRMAQIVQPYDAAGMAALVSLATGYRVCADELAVVLDTEHERDTD